MKTTQQLLNERYMIFLKYLEKKCEGIYSINDREERQRKSNLWQKYLWRRYEELDNKINGNNNIQAMVSERN